MNRRIISIDGARLILLHRMDEFTTLYPNGVYDVIRINGGVIGKVYKRRRKLHYKPPGKRYIVNTTSANKWFWSDCGRLEANTMREAVRRVLRKYLSAKELL